MAIFPLHHRRELSAPARAAGEGRLPEQLPRGGIETTDERFFQPRLRDEQLAINVEWRGEAEEDIREITPPEQASRVLLHGDDLALCRVRVKPATTAYGQVLHRAFKPSCPPHAQRRGEVLVVRVLPGEVAVVRVPIILRFSQLAFQRAADLGNLQIRCRRALLGTGGEDVEITILTGHKDAAISHRHRCGDRGSVGGFQLHAFSTCQRDDLHHAIQPAVDQMIFG